MGTIDDFDYGSCLHDLDLEKEEREQEIQSRINASKAQEIVDGIASEIFNYLPINKTSLDQEEYIQHLWASFTHLNSGSEEARGFSVMPFHLLFMLSLQYKVFRISKRMFEKYKMAFMFKHLDNDHKLCPPESVYDLARIKERSLPDLFSIVGTKEDIIARIKQLIDNRNNNLGHAKGGMEVNAEGRIMEYITCLEELQMSFQLVNDDVADDWLKEMGTGQEGIGYIDTHLAGDYLCPADMKAGRLSKLDSRLNSR